MSSNESRSSSPISTKFGEHLGNGLQRYVEQIQQWIGPILIAALLGMVSLILCYLPLFFVMGPISAGLSYCGVCCVRKERVSVAKFWQPWNGDSLLAGIGLIVLQMVPALVTLPLFIGLVIFLSTQLPMQAPSQATPLSRGESIERIEHTDNEEISEATESGKEVTTPASIADDEAWIIVSVILFYGMLIMLSFVSIIWAFWINTRTMFVLPLIADRQLGAGEAFRLSWLESKVRFWELLLLQIVAGVIGSLGVYACYIGMLFTIPAQITILACAYDERFPADEDDPPKSSSEGIG